MESIRIKESDTKVKGKDDFAYRQEQLLLRVRAKIREISTGNENDIFNQDHLFVEED